MLGILQLFLNKPWRKKSALLSVSIIISVYNEEAVIHDKIENTLSLDYPESLMEVIVSSDGSTDKTHEIVSSFNDSRVILKKNERIGKTECLNKAVPQARGELILFTDANSMFPPDLLKNLSENFGDPDVGLVTGWTKYLKTGGGKEVTGLYAKMEKMTKYWESRLSSCVGADGAVFATRNFLFCPLRADDINDFIIPINVLKQKKRVVLDPRVFCWEEATDSGGAVYRRQVRITTRTLWAIRRNLCFLNFIQYGSFSFFLLSHKVLRLSVPFFFICTFLISLSYLGFWWLYNAVFTAYMIFFVAGILSLFGIVKARVASVCLFFLITFGAQLTGWFRMIAGIKDTIWTPRN